MCNKEAENALLSLTPWSRKEAGSENQQKSGFGLGFYEQFILFGVCRRKPFLSPLAAVPLSLWKRVCPRHWNLAVLAQIPAPSKVRAAERVRNSCQELHFKSDE